MTKAKVLVSTDRLSREEWLDYRRQGIGGSDASVILNASQYRSPYALWADKRGVSVPDEAGDAAQWGHDLELVVAKRYARETNSCVVAIPAILQSVERPWQLANVDFFIVPDSLGYTPGTVTHLGISAWDEYPFEAILEIKTTGIVGRGNREGWANGAVPLAYVWQGVHYAAVTGIRNVTYAALVAGEGLVVRDMQFDDTTIDYLNEREAEFWGKVQSGEAPEMTGDESEFDVLKAQYPASQPGTSVEVDEWTADLVREYQHLKRSVDEATKHLDEVRAQLIAAVGDAEQVTFEGEPLFTYKSTKDGVTVDTKALLADHPELAVKYQKTKQGYRVLRIKGEQ